MRRQTKTIVVGIASVLIVGAGALPALAQADDQERLDAAIDSFEQRMTDAGWVAEPSDDDGDLDDVDDVDDDDADDDADDGGIDMGDDEFEECFGELAVMFEDIDDDEFPGQTASSESDEFTYLPEGVPETTEEFSFDFGDVETVAAIAVSVEDANVELMDSFVDTIGAKETADCIRESMEAEMAADATSDDELAGEFEVAVENEADLGVGDRSARLEFGLTADFMGFAIAFDVNMYMARTDNDLVMVLHSTVGEPALESGFDPVAELQTLVDSL